MNGDIAMNLSCHTAAQHWHLCGKSVSSCFPGRLLGNQFSILVFWKWLMLC